MPKRLRAEGRSSLGLLILGIFWLGAVLMAMPAAAETTTETTAETCPGYQAIKPLRKFDIDGGGLSILVDKNHTWQAGLTDSGLSQTQQNELQKFGTSFGWIKADLDHDGRLETLVQAGLVQGNVRRGYHIAVSLHIFCDDSPEEAACMSAFFGSQRVILYADMPPPAAATPSNVVAPLRVALIPWDNKTLIAVVGERRRGQKKETIEFFSWQQKRATLTCVCNEGKCKQAPEEAKE